jgi:hypothetical protein
MTIQRDPSPVLTFVGGFAAGVLLLGALFASAELHRKREQKKLRERDGLGELRILGGARPGWSWNGPVGVEHR